MRLHGQRWEYRVGNALVHVDNAFSWSLWAQERLVVNLEPVKQAGAWLALRRSFKEPWLTLIGEDELRVVLKGKIAGIDCRVTLVDAPLEPSALLETSWTGGRNSWPPEEEWRPTERMSFGMG